MTQELIIMALVIVIIYLYYQNRKLSQLPHSSGLDNNSATSTQTIFELDENQADLIADKDEAIRKKKEAEQEVLSLSNQLKNKQSEVTRKDQEIERLKSEKNLVEVNLNQKLTEWKTKYSKQGQLLDTEQLECKKLEEKIEQLNELLTKEQKKVELLRKKRDQENHD